MGILFRRKLIVLSCIGFVLFNINLIAQNESSASKYHTASVYHFGFEVTSRLSTEKFERIRKVSQESFAKFRLKSRPITKLKRGKAVKQYKVYGRRWFARNINSDSSDFRIFIPRIDFVQLFQDPKLNLYYLIDEKMEYLQLVALDTNNLESIQFLSGHVSNPEYKNFNSFKRNLYLKKSKYDSARMNDLEYWYKDFSRNPNIDSFKNVMEKLYIQNLWMSIMNVPFSGPCRDLSYTWFVKKSKIYKRTEYNLQPPSLAHLELDSLAKLDKLEGMYRQQGLTYSIDPEYKRVNINFCAYYSQSLDMANKFNSKLFYDSLRLHFKAMTMTYLKHDSISMNQFRNVVKDSILDHHLDTLGFVINSYWRGVRVENNLFTIECYKEVYCKIHLWTYCFYLCPFTFIPPEKNGTILEFDSLYNHRNGKNKIKLIKEHFYPPVGKEIIGIGNDK